MWRRTQSNGKYFSIGARALLVLFLFVGLCAAVLAFGEFFSEISMHEMERIILSWGMWGVLASIALMIIHSFIPFPAEFLAMANGMVYGPIWGTVITWTGAMLGAALAFALARALGRPFVEALVARKN